MRFLKSFKFLLAISLISRFHEAYSVIYPEIRISDEVKKLINEDIDKSCNFNEDAKTTLPLSLNLVHTSNAVTDLQEILDLIEKNCISDFTKKINKILAKDMLRAHQAKLESIKEEIEDFKAKNLSASFQIKKYLNYIEKNKIEGLMLDPSVQELYNKNKSKFEARKNNCSDVMNLKLPLALHKTKVQGKTGWCYAYAASDLVANFTGK